MTSSVPLRRCVCRLELRRSSREIDELKSDVIHIVGSATDSAHRQSSRHRLCVEDGVFYSHERLVCVPEACDVTNVKVELDPWVGNRDYVSQYSAESRRRSEALTGEETDEDEISQK